MVSSTVFGIEYLLEQIFAVLLSYGYSVWMSYKGTVPLSPRLSALANCIDAVEKCDAFFGIITGRYGSGIEPGELAITHREVRKAVEIEKPRWFMVHRNVTVARELLKQFRFNEDKNPRPDFIFRKTSIIDDIRVIEMYEDAIQDNIPLPERRGNWSQPFLTPEDVLRFVEHQFSDIHRIHKLINES
jgi:hypothetical protein